MSLAHRAGPPARLAGRHALDDALIEAHKENYQTTPITEAERVMVDYVVKLTKDATKVSPRDHERL